MERFLGYLTVSVEEQVMYSDRTEAGKGDPSPPAELRLPRDPLGLFGT